MDIDEDLMKVSLFIVGLVMAVAFASWNPESILDGGSSPVRPEGEGSLELMCNISFLKWGSLYSGQQKTRGILLSNVGFMPGFVSLKTENWDPVAAAQFLNLSWNLEGVQVMNGESVAGTLELAVSREVRNITDFSFDIVIYLSEEKMRK